MCIEEKVSKIEIIVVKKIVMEKPYHNQQQIYLFLKQVKRLEEILLKIYLITS